MSPTYGGRPVAIINQALVALCAVCCVCVRVCVFRVWHIIESVLGRSWRNDSQLSKTGSASCAPQVYKNEVGCSGLLLPRLGARL